MGIWEITNETADKKGVPACGCPQHQNTAPFAGLECEVVQADITNMQSLTTALQGIQTFYAVGAAFKLWAKRPKRKSMMSI